MFTKIIFQKIGTLYNRKIITKVGATFSTLNAILPKNVASDGVSHFNWLKEHSPCFPVRSSDVKIIKEPKQFYNKLIELGSNSERRITIASLYLGTGKLEEDLVNAFKDSLKKSPDVSMNVLLDCSRSSRGKPNSREMFLPLLSEYPSQVNVCLFHSPDLRGLKRRIFPERWNEIFGLSHLKVYLFDDTVILSGANLNDQYFTNRQDRYIEFQNSPELADFFDNLVQTVSSFSFKLTEKNELNEPNEIHPFKGNRKLFTKISKEKVEKLIKPCSIENSEADTWVFPLIQMYPIGISHDEIITKRIFSTAPENSKIKLSTGYFNLTQSYIETIVHNSQAKYEILLASPKANGFFNASGISKYVPAMYSHIANTFYNMIRDEKLLHRLSLFEYDRSGWTFHAKGMWYYLPNQELPCLTLIGSPNFGYRSVYRDLECQVALVTEDPALQEALNQEQEDLYKEAALTSRSTFEKAEHDVPFWVVIVAYLIRSFF